MQEEYLNEDNDEFTIDDLSMDTQDSSLKLTRKLDLEKYKEARANKVTVCMYCGKKDLFSNGSLSITAKNRTSDRTEPPVWFCCETCANMYKHETGIVTMPDEQFKDMFKRGYPAMYKKRYSV